LKARLMSSHDNPKPTPGALCCPLPLVNWLRQTVHRGLLLSCAVLSKQGTSKGLAAQKI